MSFRVNPYRFSNDPGAMIDFLQALGLRVRTTAADGRSWALLEGRAGAVAVHHSAGSTTGATPGQTQLVLLTESVDSAADKVRTNGVELTVWDESYGRQGGITDPFGGGIWVNEEMQDLHGYTEPTSPQEPSDMTVCAVRYSPDFAADAAFFAPFGFSPRPAADEWWTPLVASATSGTIGLHKPSDEPITAPAKENPVGENPVVHLAFETATPLEQVRDRLTAAGYQAALVQDEFLTQVTVVDPDGCEVQVHRAR